MRAFVAGAVVGAALGVAGTLAFRPPPERQVVVEVRDRDDARRSPRSDGGRARDAVSASDAAEPTAPDDPAASAPATAAPAPSPDPPALESMLATLRSYETSKPPGDPATKALVAAIAKQFPDYRYPKSVAFRWSGLRDGNVVEAVLTTWTNETLLEVLTRTFDPSDNALFDPGLGIRCGEMLRNRGVPLPEDLSGRLLRDESPDLRKKGIGLAIGVADVDLDRLKELAARDPDVNVRSTAVYAFRWLVEVGRKRPEDVSDPILAAMSDPDATVRSAAADSLVAAGPAGGRVAIETLARDGAVPDWDDLVNAAVADGRAAEVLDLRLGPEVDANVAISLARLAATRPALLLAAKPRFPELLRALGAEHSDEVFFAALLRVGESTTVSACVLDRTAAPELREAAIDAYLAVTSTAAEGRALARRIVADRAERTAVRLMALDLIDSAVPAAEEDTVSADNRRFLTELLTDETNERMRTEIGSRLRWLDDD